VTADAFVRMLSPMAPHVCEELWERMGHDTSVAFAPWPEYDEDLAALETVTMVVQVNGRVRDRIEVDASITAEEAERLALASERARAHMGEADPIRVIVRPPNLVNVVVR
jgi:leucyl-tRNA synthetase